MHDKIIFKKVFSHLSPLQERLDPLQESRPILPFDSLRKIFWLGTDPLQDNTQGFLRRFVKLI